MTLNDFLQKLRHAPNSIEFDEVIALVNKNYSYTPTAFTNGTAVNEAGTNEGSCKIFSFAQLQGLNRQETLALFGGYYRDDVLGNPEGKDHANIRNFMQKGWSGIQFEGEALFEKLID